MHPVIQIQGNNGDNLPFLSSIPWVIVVLALLEFAFLYRVLTRDDFDTLTRILWVIVIIGAPGIGLVLYLLAAPSAWQPRSPRARRATHGDELAGTPWADDPGYTKPS